MAKTRAIRIRGRMPNLKMVPKEVMAAGMPRIVKAVEAQAKENAPKRRGYASSKSIVSRIKGSVQRAGERGIVVSKAPHSHWFELTGVSGHSLAPGSGKRRWRRAQNPHRVLKIYGNPSIIRRGAWHGGHGKQPFLVPALEQSDRNVDKILKQEGDKALAEAVVKAVDAVDIFSF